MVDSGTIIWGNNNHVSDIPGKAESKLPSDSCNSSVILNHVTFRLEMLLCAPYFGDTLRVAKFCVGIYLTNIPKSRQRYRAWRMSSCVYQTSVLSQMKCISWGTCVHYSTVDTCKVSKRGRTCCRNLQQLSVHAVPSRRFCQVAWLCSDGDHRTIDRREDSSTQPLWGDAPEKDLRTNTQTCWWNQVLTNISWFFLGCGAKFGASICATWQVRWWLSSMFRSDGFDRRASIRPGCIPW